MGVLLIVVLGKGGPGCHIRGQWWGWWGDRYIFSCSYIYRGRATSGQDEEYRVVWHVLGEAVYPELHLGK